MAGRVSRAVLILLALATAARGQTAETLAGYSFDEDELSSGPDTFAIFEHARGRVRLSTDFHTSGYRSVKLTDAAGDHDFPELQGYFPTQRQGRLYAHFAFLTTDAHQELNIALAGPRRFTLEKDGIAFWLLVDREGVLRHMSDSIPKRLANVQPFVWYTVDVDYDIDAGQYALRIWSEAAKEAVADLRAQPNAASHAGSSVDTFSFIGDLEDASNVTYYVDDIVIGTREAVRLGPFVAPGRRRLFVDSYLAYRRMESQRPTCFTPVAPADLGLTPTEIADAPLLAALQRALRSEQAADDAAAAVRAAASYRAGCAALDAGEATRAAVGFERAEALAPAAPLYHLSRALALIAGRRFDEAAQALSAAYPDLYADSRYAVTAGLLAMARGDLAGAEGALREAANTNAPAAGSRPRDAYYFALLVGERYDEAREYARRQVEPLAGREREAAQWLERMADAAFYAGARDEARDAYRRAVELAPEEASAILKLSDLAFLDGDLPTERALRERYYGALRPE